MTQSQLVERIRTNLNDAGIFYSNDDLNNSIQDGHDEIVAISGTIDKGASLTFTPNLSYYDLRTSISDFTALVAIYNSVTKRYMIPVSTRILDGMRDNWEIAIGTPEYFVPLSWRHMVIFRKPSTTYGSMYVFYKASSPTLTSASNLSIPNEFQRVLEEYSTGDLLEQALEIVKAQVYFQKYIQGIEELRTHVKSSKFPDYTARLRG